MGLSNSLSSLLFRKTSIRMTSRFLRHLVCGGVGTLLYMANLTFLVEILRQGPVLSSICSFVFLILFTYGVSRFWVFESIRAHGYSVPRFLIVAMVGLSLNTGVMYFAVEIMGWWYIWGQLSATLIIPPTNFLLNFYWTFK